jgi:O-antigen ligase
MHLGAAIAGLICGVAVTQQERLVSSTPWSALLLGVVVIGYVSILLSVEPELLFTFWIFAAPFFQDSAQSTASGKELARVFYILPPLILILLLIRKRSAFRGGPVDLLPALYFGYILVSNRFISPVPLKLSSDVHRAYVTVGIGIVGYYFAAFGPTTRRLGERFAGAFLGSATLVGLLGIVDHLTGWNLWHQTAWQAGGTEAGSGVSRAVSTIGPASLGTFLGIGVVFAIAILVWDGPQSLRRLSKVFIVVAIPAIYFTYTRGPMVATIVASALMLLLSARSRWRSFLVIAGLAVALVFVSGRITSSSIYQSRFSNSSNVQARLVLQRASITLAERKPITGWGYGSFNTVKNTANIPTDNYEALIFNTSHNTFLTILVELGLVGILLFLVPWAAVYTRVLSATRHVGPDRWLFVAAAATLPVYFISASTFDVRFFSFVPAQPWIVLGVARRLLFDDESATPAR